MLKIAIDAMGGDHSPKEPINGIKSYLEEFPDKNIFFYIIGKKEKILNSIEESMRDYYKIIDTTQEMHKHNLLGNLVLDT